MTGVPHIHRGHPPKKVSDEDILEARALYEFDGWSRQQIGLTFGWKKDYTYKVIDYVTRTKLIPKKNHPRRMK